MKTTLLLSATALSMSFSTGASAQSVADQVVSQLQADGFDRIEVTNGRTQVKVEAIRGSTQVEYVYDLATGALLEQEVYAASDDDIPPGVTVRTRDRDFEDTGSAGRDDDGDDDESGDERDDDESGDERDDDEGGDDERDDDEGGDDERDDDEDDDEDDDDEDDDDGDDDDEEDDDDDEDDED